MTVVIAICLLLLIAYLFEFYSEKINVPTVMILLLVGFLLREIITYFKIPFPDIFFLLPALGNLGLLLIVLEATLSIKLNREHGKLLFQTLGLALASIIILSFLLALALRSTHPEVSFRELLLMAAVFAGSSSAVAISSSKHLPTTSRNFVVYESSFSDILSIMFFNFLLWNQTLSGNIFFIALSQLIITVIISAVSIYFLFFLIQRIEHEIKFIPIILLVILIYSVSEIMHLPGLIFILFFGLFLNNYDRVQSLPWLKKMFIKENPGEVTRFKDLVVEFTFLIKSIFFLVFGFAVSRREVLNLPDLFKALVIVAVIFGLRWLLLKLMRIELDRVLYFAPRGLITILLFVTLQEKGLAPFLSRGMVFQVVFLSCLVMVIGNLAGKKQEEKIETRAAENPSGSVEEFE
ncbi:MAG TPA: cation:proton antiporter [Candidatus Saccharicenans sp.]|nr:cation:proton antiporter [Candidatus Saccharicenans sp.]HOL45820.1 cation:proton antiporter [Candidatus Saccharicenans sp.]HOT68756.1 cation:proton antiporter [Candidatus Saccharicenans sp.]HPC87602.1 cation:proton antiporter [Candidatus Saccharicenans sp.]HPP23917.1 cation:proton antiporter [Candidatus Saccharicenans sp.]